jgi:hypothetical protein
MTTPIVNKRQSSIYKEQSASSLQHSVIVLSMSSPLEALIQRVNAGKRQALANCLIPRS